MPTHLYDTLYRKVKQHWPEERITRVRLMTLMMLGMLMSRSVHLSRIALSIPGTAKVVSNTRKLTRFLSNTSFDVKKWYGRIAADLIKQAATETGEVRLLVDGTKVGFSHQLLIITLACRRRSMPIVWTWIPYPKGHSKAEVQLELLEEVKKLVPDGVPVVLAGDSEFGPVEVLKKLSSWNWDYVLRQKGCNYIYLSEKGWVKSGDIVTSPGKEVWLKQILLTREHVYIVNLLIIWKQGEKEPWILATTLESRNMVLCVYKRRMWIEQMFADMKGKGFDLESTHLIHKVRLNRLTLIVAILYVWLFSLGTLLIKKGKKRIVDRNDRRDLSIFQLGFRFLERCITNNSPVSIRLRPVPI